MAYGKKNHISTDISRYNITLLGESKLGKTTLMHKVCEKEFGEDGYLFAELGLEKGADAIEGINYVNCPDWDSSYDEITNSLGFATLCDDIVANKSSEYAKLKVLICDTYDNIIPIAEKKAIALWNRDNPEKRTSSIKATWGGFDGPTKKVLELIESLEGKLNNVGVTVWWIGHVKNKETIDAMTNESYNKLTSDVAQSYYKPLQKRQHIVGMLYTDRTIVKEKTGRKNAVTKEEEMIKRVTSESRKIKFRDDGYVADVGGRFADIVPEIELDTDAFIKAVKDAIAAESAKSGKTLAQVKKEDAKKEKALAERVEEREQDAKLAEINAQNAAAIKANYKSDPNNSLWTEISKISGRNPGSVADIETATKINIMLKEKGML